MKLYLFFILLTSYTCYFFKNIFPSLSNQPINTRQNSSHSNKDNKLSNKYYTFTERDITNLQLPNFTLSNTTNNECLYKEGELKVRDIDSSSKDIPISYAILTAHHLTYYHKRNSLESIEGSIKLSKIEKTIKIINGYPKCFQLTTLDSHLSSCSICAKNETEAHEWINAISQNIINCNQIERINNFNQMGMQLTH